MTHYRFLEPLDVLFLRGNKLFGDPGSYGESLIPPWPSVAAGALRSRILADDGVNLSDFAAGRVSHHALGKLPDPNRGTPAEPGSFAITSFHLARRDAQGRIETLHPLPADIVVTKRDDESVQVTLMKPQTPAAGLLSSSPLPQLVILAEDKRAKPESGYWLNAKGWKHYLCGQALSAQEDLVKASDLWQLDARVGVGLDAVTGRADDGKLFTVQAIAFKPGVGFLAGVIGADLPTAGMVRLGGDGRGAAVHSVNDFKPVEPDYEAIAKSGRCRVVLTAPGLFAEGWKLPGLDSALNWQLGGLRAKIVAAAVPRAEVISGWDLAKWQPKPAQKVAPTGSVYWLENLTATSEALRKLAECGLWLAPEDNSSRRAEGFNRFILAAWR